MNIIGKEMFSSVYFSLQLNQSRDLSREKLKVICHLIEFNYQVFVCVDCCVEEDRFDRRLWNYNYEFRHTRCHQIIW